MRRSLRRDKVGCEPGADSRQDYRRPGHGWRRRLDAVTSPARLRQRRLGERPGLRLWLRMWFRRRQRPRPRLRLRRDRWLWLWFRQRPRRWRLRERRPWLRPVRLPGFVPRSLRLRRAADSVVGRLGLAGEISRHLAMIPSRTSLPADPVQS
jgi:hypothetical protein